MIINIVRYNSGGAEIGIQSIPNSQLEKERDKVIREGGTLLVDATHFALIATEDGERVLVCKD
ncbi:hypothetical protein VTH8203_01495 [Vibrio thalassae]|uniref:Uncharacterized protein n=1 Tax=Vibrio thalassae TaxID=1243014 RepID=A0A240EIW4_9VIBR|nr:hypothetical protein [Vibrio thalassae]SNX47880.1 hypothetical protein VTH8203_01495 [Vibrio thalassae]